MKDDIREVTFRLIEPDDYERELEGFDTTKLTAINTCPTWGILRYGLHKQMPGTGRAMALEAGGAAHEAFAALRVAQLWTTHPGHARHSATRIFGDARGRDILDVIRTADETTRLRDAALCALHSSGYSDSPHDKRRTLNNIEQSVTAFCQNYDIERFPVWIEDQVREDGLVGIELPFELLIEFVTHDGEVTPVRITGRIDGIHWNREVGGEILVHENKTTSRLDEAWARAFDISHQPTTYVLAASVFTNSLVSRCVIRGLQIPLPKMILNGLTDVWVTREAFHHERWLAWVWHTYTLYQQYKGDIINAPRYTHSCNRYFRPCAFIPFCGSNNEEAQMVLDEMVTEEWSPLTKEGEDA